MAIEVDSLTKRYRNVTAVDGISFTVNDASTFAFLGTNGAGKTTTIGCLTTTLGFDSGNAQVAGYDVGRDGLQVRKNIGVVFQDSLMDPTLTVEENLRFRARLNHMGASQADNRINELAKFLEYDDFIKRRYGALSGGQRRRVDIARALLHEPSILFLDEPTSGLDPASRAVVWKAIHELRHTTGLTVFLTTHYMEETEQADQVCIIEAGRIIAHGTPAQLRARHSHSILTITSSDPEALINEVAAASCSADISADSSADISADSGVDSRVVQLTVDNAATARAVLAEHGDRVVDFEFRHGRMDDVFLALTGHEGDSQ